MWFVVEEDEMREYLERSLKPVANPRVICAGDYGEMRVQPTVSGHHSYLPAGAAEARATSDLVIIEALKKQIQERKFGEYLASCL